MPPAQSPLATRPLRHTQTASVQTREAAVGPNASSGLVVRHSTNVHPFPGVDGSIQEGMVRSPSLVSQESRGQVVGEGGSDETA